MKIINLLVLVLVGGSMGYGQVRGLTRGQEPTLAKPFSGPTVANPPSGNPSPGFTPKAPPGFSGFRVCQRIQRATLLGDRAQW
jgi:hypothetical protein